MGRTKYESDSGESSESPSDDQDSDYEPEAKRVKKKVFTKQASKNVEKSASKPPKAPKQPKATVTKKTSVKRKRVDMGITSSKKIKTEPSVKNEIPGNDVFTNLNSSSAVKIENETSDEIKPSTSREVSSTQISRIVENAKKFHVPWKDEEVVSSVANVSINVAQNVISLLEQDCTIPFIVRYRREKTGGLLAEKLRDIQAAYEEVKQVHKRVENILKTVKSEKFNETTAASLLRAKTLEDVEFLYTPFKSGSKRTLAERSRQLGLEPVAMQILESTVTLPAVNFDHFIKPEKGEDVFPFEEPFEIEMFECSIILLGKNYDLLSEEIFDERFAVQNESLQNKIEITKGIQHIISDVISKDRRVLDFVQSMSNEHRILLTSSKSASAEKEDRQAYVAGKTTENFKFENYFDLKVSVRSTAHHQVMAINRGEKLKVLTVKVVIPSYLQQSTKNFIWQNFFNRRHLDPETLKFVQGCIGDSYERLIEPHISRQIRSELSKKAEKESISMFCSNVKSLLLTPPVRGKTVIGIDPGFFHGCKIAVISSKGEVLATDVIYPHMKNQNAKSVLNDKVKLKDLISSFGAEIVAIGNGTACRETELWVSNLITSKFLQPFEIKYCIVNESGVSIYSVTSEAEAELPNMDPNLRSAVAIARRLQDPLLEYVKIEPKHLGVGMYQHDLSESQLQKALDGVVEECVSFVGVDLNVCPEVLLRKISGLNATKAKNIVEWRNQHGSFVNRQQLLEVKGLGPKSFEQCAGFVKILPETCTSYGATSLKSGTKSKLKDKHFVPNPLDRTIIHPESYEIAERFLKELKVNPEDVGMQVLVNKVKSYMQFTSTEDVAKSFNVPVPAMQLIIDAFEHLLDYDIRGEFDQPLFMTSVRQFSDLESGQELTGRVMNLTGFGAFVDIGVQQDGLIHISQMGGRTVQVGERVTVKVRNVEAAKKRIALQLVN